MYYTIFIRIRYIYAVLHRITWGEELYYDGQPNT